MTWENIYNIFINFLKSVINHQYVCCNLMYIKSKYFYIDIEKFKTDKKCICQIINNVYLCVAEIMVIIKF